MRLSLWIGVASVCLAASAVAADRDFSMVAEPLFLGTETPVRVQPYLLTIENRGKTTSGVISVETGEFSMRYPIDLPEGSRKRIVSYITTSGFFQGMAILRTPLGGTRFQLESRPSGQRCLAVVSDASGELGFIRKSGDQRSAVEAYVKPEMMPDRSAAYAGLVSVWLGDGAERMSDDAAQALKRYITSGGTVIFSGGASAPILEDPRWSSFLPMSGSQPRTLTLDAQIRGMIVKGACTVSVGNLSTGATTIVEVDQTPFALEKRHGLGRVVLVAANLTEGPAKQWVGREKFLSSIGVLDPDTALAKLLGSVSPDPYSGTSSPYTSTYIPEAGSPFSTQVPSTSTVLGILFVYFILVVPVNLIAMRKLGKGEWAWISSPIISFAFAAVFFRFSANLYAADLSVATSGVLVQHEGDGNATYVGRVQIFFPSGGRYDLQLEGVEAVFTQDRYSANPGQVATMASLGLIDDGEIRAPSASVTNLAFREFSVLQRLEVADGVEVSVSRVDGKADKVVVTNRSQSTFDRAGVILGDSSFDVGTLNAGESKTVTTKGYTDSALGAHLAATQVSRTSLGGRPMKGSLGCFVANVSGMKAGPGIGRRAKSYGTDWLVYTFAE